MFGHSLIGYHDKDAHDRLRRNFTEIPSSLLICVFDQLGHQFDVAHEAFDNHNQALRDAVDIHVETCTSVQLTEYILRIVAMIFGFPGNIMAAIVALSMDDITTGVFLSFLAIGDFLTILLRTTTAKTPYPAFEVLKATIGFFPNSILVLICFERFVAVCYPFKKKKMFTMKTAYWLVGTLAVLYIPIYVMCLFIVLSKVETYKKTFVVASLLFGFPCPFIMTFNCLTIRRLRKMTGSSAKGSLKFSFLSKAEASITFMIAIASVVFVALNGPLFVICLGWFIVNSFIPNVDLTTQTKTEFFISLAYWLTFLHHGANFYVYVLGTRRFRQRFLLFVKTYTPFKCIGVSDYSSTHSASQTKSTARHSFGTSVDPARDNIKLFAIRFGRSKAHSSQQTQDPGSGGQGTKWVAAPIASTTARDEVLRSTNSQYKSQGRSGSQHQKPVQQLLE